MKVLLDACTPRPVRQFLSGHSVSTAQETGWGQLKNGDLLWEADQSFDTFISTDQNLKYQQRFWAKDCNFGAANERLADDSLKRWTNCCDGCEAKAGRLRPVGLVASMVFRFEIPH